MLEGKRAVKANSVNILLDLSFVSNIRYLDQYELYLTDQVELQNTLPFASGQAMARGILDSLMSATYFNASALRLLRLLVTSESLYVVSYHIFIRILSGGATLEVERSLSEGAGLRGGYSTSHLQTEKLRVRVEEIRLTQSVWRRSAKIFFKTQKHFFKIWSFSICIFRYAENGSLFSELFARALRDTGTLCLAINRLVDADGDDKDESVDLTRVVIGAPDNDMVLQPSDNIIALVQHNNENSMGD